MLCVGCELFVLGFLYVWLMCMSGALLLCLVVVLMLFVVIVLIDLV